MKLEYKIYRSRNQERTPKNTLVIAERDNEIFFGIARCNMKADNMSKKRGVYLAQCNVRDAIENYDKGVLGYRNIKTEIYDYSKGPALLGWTRRDNLENIFKLFFSYDQKWLKKSPNRCKCRWSNCKGKKNEKKS